ncbi:MAG: hypothetical protein ACRDJF_00350 [Actinomycetota bacterium]
MGRPCPREHETTKAGTKKRWEHIPAEMRRSPAPLIPADAGGHDADHRGRRIDVDVDAILQPQGDMQAA